MNLIKFRRQYLITSKTIKELSSWQKSMFNGMNVYAEQSLQMLKTSTKNNEFLLLGYWIDVKFHHVVNEFIPLLLLMELSGMSKSRGIWF